MYDISVAIIGVLAIERDDIARARSRAADGVALDQIARARRGIESESDAVCTASRAVAGNDVARAGRRPADRVVAAAPKDYADTGHVRDLRSARGVGADQIALNQIAAAVG